MIVLEFNKEHNLKQLYDELLANGLNPELVEGKEDGFIRLGFVDGTPQADLDLAAQVVENHVAQPPPPPPPHPLEQMRTDLEALSAPTGEDIKTVLLNWLSNQGF